MMTHGGVFASMRRFSAAAMAFAVSLTLGVWLSAAQPAWLVGLQAHAGDAAWRLLAQPGDERRLILVDIDERSLGEVGPWPWPRATQARLIERLAAGGASLQVLDVVFTDPRPDDEVLRRAFAAYQPVISQVFALPGQGDNTRAGLPGGALPGQRCAAPFDSATGFVANDAALTRAAEASGIGIGHITPRLSADGVVRAQPAALCHEGAVYPALALAALMRATGESTLQVHRGSGWLDPPWQLQGSEGRMPPVPLNTRGDLRLPWWRSPSGWIGLSAADVLAGRVPAGLLQGAWVLVGGSAFGLNDSVATPFSAAAPGVQVHAQLITALLDGRVPYTPRIAPALQVAAGGVGLLLLGALVGLVPAPLRGRDSGGRRTVLGRLFSLMPRIALPWVPVLGLGWAMVLWVLHVAALAGPGWWIGWVGPAMAVIGGAIAWGMVEHALSRRERDRLYGHLSSYLPAPVAAALAAQGPSGAVSAQSRQVSVLFADIRNFSAYCEARPPEESAAVLHAFYSVASRVVEAEGGVIESFQGDAVMAVWRAKGHRVSGEPAPGDHHSQDHTEQDHARCALRAAVQLYAAIQGVLPDPAPAGLEPLALGIGLESGPAMAGSLGLASRRTHLVMGRTVTIANRLVAMTADLGFPILVGEGMAAQTGASNLQSLGTFMLEGMRVTHHIYTYTLFPSPRLDTNANGAAPTAGPFPGPAAPVVALHSQGGGRASR